MNFSLDLCQPDSRQPFAPSQATHPAESIGRNGLLGGAGDGGGGVARRQFTQKKGPAARRVVCRGAGLFEIDFALN